MESNQTLYLKWDEFSENVKQSFTELKSNGDFFDVTLSCEDKEIKAHKLILSACSPFFRRLLLKRSLQQANMHPIIYLWGMRADQLEAVVAFIYQGEVDVLEEQLDSFMLVAKDLQLKGLTALYDKEPNLFQQKFRKTVEVESAKEESSNENIFTNKGFGEMLKTQVLGLAKIETDLVNEDMEDRPVGENGLDKGRMDPTTRKGCLEKMEMNASKHQIKPDVPNQDGGLADRTNNILDNEFVLHEESIKEILDNNCLKDQKQKEYQSEPQKRETDLLGRDTLKETMLKTWSMGGKETEEVGNCESRNPETVQNVIHKDMIQKTLHKDKREALMERQDRTKTSARHWVCKVCGYKSKSKDHVRIHVETHIEGLEYVCDMCGKKQKTSAAFGVHQYRCSKKLSLSNPEISARRNFSYAKNDPYWSQQ